MSKNGGFLCQNGIIFLFDSPFPGFDVPSPEMPPCQTGVGVKTRGFLRFSTLGHLGKDYFEPYRNLTNSKITGIRFYFQIDIKISLRFRHISTHFDTHKRIFLRDYKDTTERSEAMPDKAKQSYEGKKASAHFVKIRKDIKCLHHARF